MSKAAKLFPTAKTELQPEGHAGEVLESKPEPAPAGDYGSSLSPTASKVKTAEAQEQKDRTVEEYSLPEGKGKEKEKYEWDLSGYNWLQNAKVTAMASSIRNLADAVSVPYHYRQYSSDRHSVMIDLSSVGVPNLRILIYTPTKGRVYAVPGTVKDGEEMGQRKKRGVMVHLAGGGFTMCRPENEGHLCRSLCDSLSCILIAPDYVKAPQHPFPEALNQMHGLLRWIAAPSDQPGLMSFLAESGPPSTRTFIPNVDPTKITLSGNSSGGNLAAALVVKGIHADLPLPNNARIVGLGLSYAMLDVSLPYGEKLSYVPDKSKVLPRWLTRMFLDGYLGELRTPDKAALLKDPLLSPGLAPVEVLQKFPRTVVITAENDYLCWEGEVFAKRLEKEAGFIPGDQVLSKTFRGVGHGFDIAPNMTKATEAIHTTARNEAWGMIFTAFDKEL